MGKFKAVEAGTEFRNFTGKLRVLSQENKFLFSVEVWLLNGEVNSNNWQYMNLEAHRHLFADTPILVAYVHGGAKVGSGHNFRIKRDEKGNEYASFTDGTAERIVGWFKNDADIRIEEKDGVSWIVGSGFIWTHYAHELTTMLKEQGTSGMDVSIETLIQDMHMNGKTEVFTKYSILGTTILGAEVTPAVAGAHIKALSVADGLKDFRLRVAAHQEKTARESEKKGNGKRMAFNKAQLEAIKKQFKDYTVVGHSDDGMNICLLSNADGCLYGYTRNADDGDAIVESRIKPVALSSVATFDGGSEVNVDILAANESLEKALEEALSAKEKAEKDAMEEHEANVAMVKKENARRRNAVKTAVNSLIAEYNENSDDPTDKDFCADVLKDADEDAFNSYEDDAGEFVGANRACEIVKARLFDRDEETAKRKMAKANSVHSWLDGVPNTGGEAQTGIPGFLGRVNKDK